MGRFETQYAQISILKRTFPLYIGIQHDDKSQKGIQVFWSFTEQYPCEKNNQGEVSLQNTVTESMITIEKAHCHAQVYLGIYSYSEFVNVYMCHSFINTSCKKVLSEECYVTVAKSKPTTPVKIAEEDEDVPEPNGIKHKLNKF